MLPMAADMMRACMRGDVPMFSRAYATMARHQAPCRADAIAAAIEFEIAAIFIISLFFRHFTMTFCYARRHFRAYYADVILCYATLICRHAANNAATPMRYTMILRHATDFSLDA